MRAILTGLRQESQVEFTEGTVVGVDWGSPGMAGKPDGEKTLARALRHRGTSTRAALLCSMCRGTPGPCRGWISVVGEIIPKRTLFSFQGVRNCRGS